MNKKGQEGAFWGIFVVVFALIVLFLVLGFDQVDASHRGVMVKFGEVKGDLTEGLHWTGIFTTTHQYDMRIRKAQVDMLGEQSATDKDGQAVYGSVAVNYRLKNDPRVVIQAYREVGRDDVIADKLLLNNIIREGFKQATVKYEAIEILEKRQEVKELAKENIKSNFPDEYFEITDITVTNIDFSDEFKAAIEAKKVETQNKLKEEQRLEVVKLQQAQELVKYETEAKKLELQKQQVTDQLNTQLMLQTWDGKLPQYLIITPDSNGMFLQLAQGELNSGETGGESKQGE